MKVLVTTTINQEIEVPEGATREDILVFLAENQSFNDAFQGISDSDQEFRIVNVTVVEEEIAELSEGPY
jgi:hypothetical protein